MAMRITYVVIGLFRLKRFAFSCLKIEVVKISRNLEYIHAFITGITAPMVINTISNVKSLGAKINNSLIAQSEFTKKSFRSFVTGFLLSVIFLCIKGTENEIMTTLYTKV
ncbi:MAG TPA: hypothetical protein VHA74_03360 [Candidatus Dojkabacteria bacterium]|nr:hypothetical protein [Candidatus Dojkabacteria bacterium]